MSKRKREDDADEHDAQIEDQAIRIKVSRLRVKLDQGLKKLTSALKLARGFERQKMGRRQKEASKEPHTLLRLREEVILLKQMQLGQTAKTHLFKNLSRTKRIRENPAFAHIYDEFPTVESTKPGAEANVLGRLFNSAPVKQAFDEVMKSIFGVLGIPQVPNSDGNSKSKKGTHVKHVANGSAEDDEFNGFSSVGSPGEGQSDREHSTSEVDADALYKHRLAASDEDSDDDEGSSDEQDPKLRELSISASEDEDNLDPRRERTSTKAQKIVPTTKTAFLPSLSMGGYYSGSESDGEDDFARRSPPGPEIRKNRRGQRARQQLAEKKFGQKAKHLQNQKKQKPSDTRNSGWDAKRGAVDRRGGPGRLSNKGRPDAKDSHNRPARIDQAKPEKLKSRDDSGSLHPSWEAAKKRKMEDQGMPKFAGKKITFE
ncbi:hypothetical protein LTR84_012394 [Exophiala bonariae]|uniref:Bud22 domain-containing protein n=1 Tax=Exophiala bonariae TaxID=1690606 RepID=A0AAV9NG33_9EURO|nr:hypothetical protein LTR84_012394 [Exophiala bonariae]